MSNSGEPHPQGGDFDPAEVWDASRARDGLDLVPEPKPPGWFKQTVHSLPFYFVFAAAVVLLAWYAHFHIQRLGISFDNWAKAQRQDGSQSVFEYVTPLFGWSVWAATAISAIAVLIAALRIIRGSAMDARSDLRNDLREALLSTDGIEPSNRMGENIVGVLEDGAEKLLWESRMHPLSIPVYAWWGVRRNKFLQWFSGIYLLAIPVIGYNWGWWWLLPAAGLAAYIGYHAAEWARDCYGVTDKRIVAVTKLVATRAATMPRSRLTDVIVDVPMTAKMLEWSRLINLAWGTLDIESAGQDQALKKVHFLTGIGVIVAALRLPLPV